MLQSRKLIIVLGLLLTLFTVFTARALYLHLQGDQMNDNTPNQEQEDDGPKGVPIDELREKLESLSSDQGTASTTNTDELQDKLLELQEQGEQGTVTVEQGRSEQELNNELERLEETL